MRDNRVSTVITHEDGQVPILLNFQNGNLRPDEYHRIKCGLYTDEKTKNDTVVAASEHLIYRGEIESPSKTLVNTLIAIRNRNTGKVRIIEVDKCTLTADLSEPMGNKIEQLNLSRQKMTSELNKTFGSRRAVRRTEIYEKMKTDVDIVKEQLEKTVQEIQVDAPDIVLPNDADALSECFPPIHRNATNIDKVYVLEELISESDREALQHAASVVLKLNPDHINCCDFIKEEIVKLQSSPAENKIDCCVILLYIDALINTVVAPYRNINLKGFTVCHSSKSVNSSVIDKFTLNTGFRRARPKTLKDKAACYVIVLLLLALGHVVEYESLCKALRVKSMWLTDAARSLGVSQSKVGEKNVLVLKLPLVSAFIFRKKTNKNNLTIK